MRRTVPTGRIFGSAATIPARAFVPDCVGPLSQYAVAVTLIVDGAAEIATPARMSTPVTRILTTSSIAVPLGGPTRGLTPGRTPESGLGPELLWIGRAATRQAVI